MRRSFLVLVVLAATSGLIFGVPVAAHAQAAPATQTSLQTFLTREVFPVLDTFWSATASDNGFVYSSPRVRMFLPSPTVTSACDRSPVASHMYCPMDQTLYLDLSRNEPYSFGSLWARNKDFAVVVVVAHEWGHHIQHELGITDQPVAVRTVELQADCMAGLFARYADMNGYLDPGDLQEAVEISLVSGDPSHGSGPDRAASFFRGYQGYSLGTCGIHR